MTHLVLVGLMSGKSSVGRRVAEQLGRPFVDCDAVVEANAERTVREICTTDGEAAFRLLERDALVAALGDPTPSVVAAGGGVAVLERENRHDLIAADVTVVWLRAQPRLLVTRAAAGEHGPLLDDDPDAVLARMAADRERLYREVADFVVDVGERSVDEVAADVLSIDRRLE